MCHLSLTANETVTRILRVSKWTKWKGLRVCGSCATFDAAKSSSPSDVTLRNGALSTKLDAMAKLIKKAKSEVDYLLGSRSFERLEQPSVKFRRYLPSTVGGHEGIYPANVLNDVSNPVRLAYNRIWLFRRSSPSNAPRIGSNTKLWVFLLGQR